MLLLTFRFTQSSEQTISNSKKIWHFTCQVVLRLFRTICYLMSIFSLIQTNALFSIIRKIHDNFLKLLNYNQKLKVNIYLSCFLRAFSLNFSISFWSSLESLLPFSSASINCCWSNLFSSINVVICTSTTPLSPSLLSLLVCVCSCKPTSNRNPNNYKLNII